MSPNRETYEIKIAGLQRVLPIVEVKPGVRVAFLNILGDTELVQACAKALYEKLFGIDFDILVTAEAKSIPLAHALAVEACKPYVILRRVYKPYMGNTLSAETRSIGTGSLQKLYLDEKDQHLLRDQRVVLVDDVLSSGATIRAMRHIVEQAGGKVVGKAAILTEGDPRDWGLVIALGHLPLF